MSHLANDEQTRAHLDRMEEHLRNLHEVEAMPSATNKIPLPEERAAGLLEALATAFGGMSQFSAEDLGRAVAGHRRNQGAPSTLLGYAVAAYFEYWGDSSNGDRLDFEAKARAAMTPALGL